MTSATRLDLRPYFQTLKDVEGPFVWSEFFGNDNPVEVEVGTGRGLFLYNAGRRHPDINFLGFEINFKEARRAAMRAHKRKMPNVRVIGGDAQAALAERIADESVQAVHVYFPDPWWKRRHKRRRIFNETLLKNAHRILHPGGLLHAWTDVEEYFDVMTELVAEHPGFGPRVTPEERPPEHDMDYHTSFERKKRKLGLPIYRAQWTKLEASAPEIY